MVIAETFRAPPPFQIDATFRFPDALFLGPNSLRIATTVLYAADVFFMMIPQMIPEMILPAKRIVEAAVATFVIADEDIVGFSRGEAIVHMSVVTIEIGLTFEHADLTGASDKTASLGGGVDAGEEILGGCAEWEY